MESLEWRQFFAVNPIVAENQLPGTPMSQWFITSDGDTSIQGFATDMSVDQGQRIDFKVNDPSLAPYRLDIYRMGYYQGHGARKVATIPASQTQRVAQPAPLRNDSVGLTDAGNWSVTASWNVPADATSGIYFANVTREDTGGFSQIIFIVRDDDGGSDMLFQTADATWQAYNAWGGQSTYIPGTPAKKVSYNRPFTTRSATPLGRDFVFGPEFAMVRFLEANGYDVSYFTNVDSARIGDEIKEHRAFLSVGHDEYWSGEMRDAVEEARDSGVHLAFFSGNEVYWKTRWENSISADGKPFRTMVVYKETRANAKIDPTNIWTGTWRDPRFSPPYDGGIPENALTGQLFTVNRGPGGETGTPMNVPYEYSNLRFWRNTNVANLQPGQTAVLGDIILGYEWDEDVDNGFRPAGLFRMSSTTQTVPEKLLDFGSTVGVGTATHTLTMYRAASGALVFGAGTVQWSYGLDGVHDGLQSTPDPAIRQATVNLFADMGIQPESIQAGLLRAVPSTDVAGPNATFTTPSANGTVVAGSPVTITGNATDTGGGVVAGIEVSVDGGRTWHRAEGRNAWSYTWIPATIGPVTLLVRASDDSGNIQAVPSARNVNVSAQPTSTVGLVGAWAFNSNSGTTAADGSGRGNTGTVSGAAWAPGVFGNALEFDGVDDWVTVNDNNVLDLTTGMTVEAWVKPQSLSGWTTVVLKEAPSGFAYALYASDNSNLPPAGYIRTGTDQAAGGIATLPVNAWTHLATTYDGTTLRLYVNGELVNSRLVTGNISTSSAPLRFGGNGVAGEFFDGLIDEVRVYGRPLNEGEIRVDMSTPIGGVIETTAPTALVSGPSNGSNVLGVVPLTASASDNVAIASAQFLLNGQPIGPEDMAAPYAFNWDSTKFANGAYQLRVRVKDYAGNITTSPAINLNVNNPADAATPAVQLRYPIDGMKVAGGLIPLWATAQDNIGVVGVQFKLNGANIGPEDIAQPYLMAFNTSTLSNGTYTLTAVARDAAGNLTTSSPVVITVDSVAPVAIGRTPASGATGVATGTNLTVTFDEDVNAATGSFVVRNPQNQVVPGSVSYNAATRTLTFTPAASLALNTTYSVTVAAVQDVAGNAMGTPATWSFTTSGTVTNATIWSPSAVPASPSSGDASAIEVGVRFSTDISGYITGVRFYKGAGNTGAHVGHVWTNDGQLLGTVNFVNETATGWQQANFTTPVQVTAGTTYVVSYYAPNGNYSVDANYFAAAGQDGGFVQALANGAAGGNGLYRYVTGGGFPTSSFNASNYWVDVVFSNTLIDSAAPTVANRSPAAGAVDVPTSGNVTVAFSEPVTAGTISVVLRDAANNTIPASMTYDPATMTATLDPSVTLAHTAVYTVTVSGAADAAGNVMSPVTWSFTTYAPDVTPPTVVQSTPNNGSTVAPASTVSVKFNESVKATSISLTVLDQNNAVVPGTTSYNDFTKTATFYPTPPDGRPPGCCGNCSHCSLKPSTQYFAQLSGVEDLAGNPMANYAWSFGTDPLIENASLWNNAGTPAVASVNDSAAVEVGVKFQSTSLGYVTSVRFYKGPSNTGTHVGHLWDANGMLMASATFQNETASGWQEVEFPLPVLIQPNTTYVASYFAPSGGYSATSGYFSSGGVVTGPLNALSNSVSGGNGVYGYGTQGVFPTSSFGATNYWVDVVFDNALMPDATAPQVASRTPGINASGVNVASNVGVTFNEPVQDGTGSVVLRDAANNIVPGAVSYDPVTRALTLDPNAPLALSTTYTVTVSGAADANGNVMDPVTWTFTTAGPVLGASLWNSSATPSTPAANDNAAIEVGMKFRANESGYITGVRFYKGAGNAGTHIGKLYNAAGGLLASITFTDETATGWQEALFDVPVQVVAGQTYVASYYAPTGRYAVNTGYFNTATTVGPLTALANGTDGPNGVYRYGAGGGFPTSNGGASNYWVDVIYTNVPPDPTIAPTVTKRTPDSNATGVGRGANVSAKFSEQVSPGSVAFVLRDAANNVIPGAITYDSVTRTATFDPNVSLQFSATYSVTVSGATDIDGNVMSPNTWSFTTAGPVVNATIWNGAATPTNPAANDNAAVEVGVKFRASDSGYITGIRFYKGTGNTGTHVGHLWSATGSLLGTVTFTNETATGWQQANFDTPVQVTAGQTYVASYYAPSGRYAADSGYFASSITGGPLTALADGTEGGNGVYRYGAGGGFPNQSYVATNYWVDVVFNSNPIDVQPPAVTQTTPAANATSVSTAANATATFSEPVQAGTVSFILRDAANNAVAAAVSYDPATRVVTLDPAGNLASDATYTAYLSASDLAGNVMTGATWSFTTAANVWRQTTAADFGAGATSGTQVTTTTDGEVRLAAGASEEFLGTTLNGYTVSSWASDGGGPTSVTVGNGTLSVAGAQVLSTQTYVNTGVEARLNFGVTPYQYFGLATSFSSFAGNYWAMFATDSGDTLKARVNVNGTTNDVSLGLMPLGYHAYRVQPTAAGFDFYIDGVLRTSVPLAFPAGQAARIAFSAYRGAPNPILEVDWVRPLSYASSGTYQSGVFDAGSVVQWSTASWISELPAGTSVLVETSSATVAGGPWSAWSAVSNGSITSPAGRYIRYRLTLATSDAGSTPSVLELSFRWA